MDEETRVAASGCFGLIGAMILVGVLGGTFRTEVTFGPPEPSATAETFAEELSSRHWLGGLVQGRQPNLRKVLDRQAAGGKSITRLSIVTKHDWTDLLAMFFTLGIYCPQTVDVSGELENAGHAGNVMQVLGVVPAAQPAGDLQNQENVVLP